MISFELARDVERRAAPYGIDDVLDRMTVESILQGLSPLERQIVRSIHLDGVTVVELAARLGIFAPSRDALTPRGHRAIEGLVSGVGGAIAAPKEAPMFRYLTAGESHGPALVGILDGIPAHLRLDVEAINETLARRQGGYGRSARMKIEHDEVEFLAGVRGSETLGSPIAVVVRNRDYLTPKVRALMDPISGAGEPLTNPRPGHADYAGALKYRQRDLRNVLERASARETAMRVCLGAICAQFLGALGIATRSYVARIGDVEAPELEDWDQDDVEAQRRALPASGSRPGDDRGDRCGEESRRYARWPVRRSRGRHAGRHRE